MVIFKSLNSSKTPMTKKPLFAAKEERSVIIVALFVLKEGRWFFIAFVEIVLLP